VAASLWEFRPHKKPTEERSFLNVPVGNEAIPEVADSGFSYQEFHNGQPFRWTDGKARLGVPLRKGESPQAVKVQLKAYRAKGVPRASVKIAANGQELFSGTIPLARVWEQTFPLGGIDLGRELAIDIVSDSFNPQGKREGDDRISDDVRTLGVQVWGVQLLPAIEAGQPMGPAGPPKAGDPTVLGPFESSDGGPGDPALTIWRGHPRGVSCGAISADGWTLVSGSWDGTVLVWDVLEGGLRKSFPRLMPRTAAIALHPDGKTFAASSNSQLVYLWETETAKPRNKLVGPGLQVLALAYSPDGTMLAAAGGVQGQPGELMLWDAATGKQRDPVPPFPLRLWDVAFSPDGKRVVVAGEDGTVSVVDTGSGKVITSFPHPAPARRLALSPDGRRLAVYYGNEGMVRMHDLDSSKPLFDFRAAGPQPIQSLRFSPGGKQLLSAWRDGSVLVWDVSLPTPQVVTAKKMYGGPLWFALLFPDGKTVASGAEDGTIRLRKLDAIE
jgi:WD40 repeat protein